MTFIISVNPLWLLIDSTTFYFIHKFPFNFGEVGENRTLVNGFADHFLTTRTLPQKSFGYLLHLQIAQQLPVLWGQLSTPRCRGEAATQHHTYLQELYCEPTNLNAASLQSLREFSQLNLLCISEGNSISLEGFSLHQPSRAIPSMTRLGGFYILHKPLTPTRVVTIAYTHKSLLCMSRVTLQLCHIKTFLT